MRVLSGLMLILSGFCILTEVWVTKVYTFVTVQQMYAQDLCISLQVNFHW